MRVLESVGRPRPVAAVARLGLDPAGWLRGRQPASWVRERDLAVGYAVAVLAVAVTVAVMPGREGHRLVLDSSTDLVNLRDHPLRALALSAFVLPSPTQVWILVPLVLAYGAVQRWLGRSALVVTAGFGHVGATLMVAALLRTGIVHGLVDRSLARATDVGVSYGLAAVAGLLVAGVPQRRRPWYLAGGTAALVMALTARRDFSDAGHLVAWGIGVALAVLVMSARRSARRLSGSGCDDADLPGAEPGRLGA